MRITKIILSVCLLFTGTSAFGQNENIDKPQVTVRFDFMVPQPVANGAFKKSFTGIFDLGAGLYLTTKGFVVGAMGRYKQFTVHANKINNTVTTQQNIGNAGISLGYDYFRTPKTLITPGINVGYNWISYNRIPLASVDPIVRNYTAVNLEPFFKVNWMIDDGFGFGFIVTYNVLFYEFNPDNVGFNQFQTYSSHDYQGITQSFSFGFCAYWNWAQHKKNAY